MLLDDPAELGFDPDRLATIDRVLGRYVDEAKLPGWSVLVSRRGRVAHLNTYGQRDVEAGLPVELDTSFRIFSMTKPITSVAALMLWEEGAFELADPIARYLPEFADMRVYVGGSGLKPKTVPATEPIRVWHLLTHTSGLTYGFHHAHPLDEIYRAAGLEWSAPPGFDSAKTIELLATLPLLFEPGTEWNYSLSTDVLGRLVEVVSGQTLREFFAERILGPLGMTNTDFPEGATARLAALYTPTADGGLQRTNTAASTDTGWYSGGGGLISTIEDYHRFTQLLLGNGEYDGVRLLGDRTVRYMMSNHLPGGADLAQFGRELFAESPFNGVGFGLGGSVTIDPVATHTLGSVGEFAWGGAASTAFWVDPVEQIAAVFMTQLLPSSTYPIRSQLRQLVYSALVDTKD